MPAPGGQLFPHVPVPAPPAVPVIAGGDPPRAGAGGRHGLEASRAVARRASRADSTSRPIASRGSGCRNERHRAGAPLSTPECLPAASQGCPGRVLCSSGFACRGACPAVAGCPLGEGGPDPGGHDSSRFADVPGPLSCSSGLAAGFRHGRSSACPPTPATPSSRPLSTHVEP